MSNTDREKWDARYRAGAFADRTHPSVLLEDWIHRLPVGRALDLACGAGRNALFLARAGFEVTGIDISRVGLDRARSSAVSAGLDVDWRCQDLDEGLDADGEFNVICVFRFLNRHLIRSLPDKLAPAGILLVEEHLAVDEERLETPIVGPSNPAFLIGPGELPALLGDLRVLHHLEGIVTDPDGRNAALAQLVATNGRDRKVAWSSGDEPPRIAVPESPDQEQPVR